MTIFVSSIESTLAIVEFSVLAPPEIVEPPASDVVPVVVELPLEAPVLIADVLLIRLGAGVVDGTADDRPVVSTVAATAATAAAGLAAVVGTTTPSADLRLSGMSNVTGLSSSR
jgi:hypothetical protein